ncbi:ATPase, T2SS/T4P/T4SS family [Geosporobacter ferrireducens]|uniref:ATPase, T2SS/T4P/T4SS family n=1 Tax=Geosporobacter ferrireducens TaxID=1424294 RepID=UPI00139BDEEC|nr:ATPase, T2SS/T4P/T4SS family [Geosporobacter ferrireducens]MTI53794.1 hypothetical protein [Geosporobacter ferrireducens]
MDLQDELKSYRKIVRKELDEYEGEEHSEMIFRCCSGDQQAEDYMIRAIREILAKYGMEGERLETLSYEIYKKEYGLSVIHDLVANRKKQYNNIECIGYDWIEVEKSNGLWERLDLSFEDEKEFEEVIRRAIQHDNKPDINTENSLMESKRVSGERITAGVRPSCYENYLFIKLFSSFTPSEESYISSGALAEEMISFTKILFKILPAIAIIGGINRGKSSFLKYLVSLLNPKFKIGTLEPDFEVKLQELLKDRNIISLQESSQFDLLACFKWLLRTNRDVIIVGEARGAEINEAGKASRRGIGCTFLTAHVIDPESLPEEFAQMHLENGIPMDIDFLMYRYAKAFPITYRIRQLEGGRRIIDDISELVADRRSRTYYRNPLFIWDPKTKEHKRVGGIKGEDQRMRMDYYNLTEEEKEQLLYDPEKKKIKVAL